MTALDFAAEPELPIPGNDMGPLSTRRFPETVIDTLLALELAADDLREMQVSTLVERDAWDARINAQREARNG